MATRLHSFVAAVAIAGQIGMAQAQSADRGPDTMAARVLACAPCHGAKGEGTKDPYFPRLAGKPAGYLYNQLLAFRNGRRHYPPMNYLLEFLPDDYLKQIASALRRTEDSQGLRTVRVYLHGSNSFASAVV